MPSKQHEDDDLVAGADDSSSYDSGSASSGTTLSNSNSLARLPVIKIADKETKALLWTRIIAALFLAATAAAAGATTFLVISNDLEADFGEAVSIVELLCLITFACDM